MLWLITKINKADIKAAQDQLRQAHLDYLKSQKNVLVFSGPVKSNDGKKSTGAVFLLNVNSREEAQAFVDAEPYTQAGLRVSVTYERIRISQWNPEAAGAEAAAAHH